MVLAAFLGVLSSSCTAPEEIWHDVCDPNPLIPTDNCATDAGADATDADASDPGKTPQGTEATCAGRCVPEPNGPSAGSWSETPYLFFMGPADIVETMSCDDEYIRAQAPDPNDKLFEKYRLYKDLDAPPAECEPCTCDKPEGTCAGLPASIEIRASMCGQSGGPSVPFDGPPGWDGSCTNENALPAGAMCGGVPCAQYVSASPLPGPTNEACAPTTTKPAFSKKTKWLTGALACARKDLEGTCETASHHCVRDLPYPWDQCVARAGIHDVCPGEYPHGPYKFYAAQPLDDRGCEACECGEPEGSVCKAYLHLYDDGACSTAPSPTLTLASAGPACGSILPPGSAVGSKAITGMTYLPGACASKGGAPIGSAKADPNPETAVTFCCLPPFYLPK